MKNEQLRWDKSTEFLLRLGNPSNIEIKSTFILIPYKNFRNYTETTLVFKMDYGSYSVDHIKMFLL